MLNHKLLICLLFCQITVFNWAGADEKFIGMPQVGSGLGILELSEVFEDSSAELSFEQILSGDYAFEPVTNSASGTDLRNLGYTHSAIWLRVNLMNSTKETLWFINTWGGLNNRVEVYLRSGAQGEFSKLQVLDHYRGAAFSFESELNMQHTLYVRIRNLQTPINLLVQLATSRGMLKQTSYEYPLFALIFGGLLTLAIYNLFYFFYLRDLGFLGVAVFIFSFVVEFGNYMGFGSYFPVLRDSLHYMGAAFAFLATASLIFVFIHLLELQKNLPKTYLLVRGFFWLFVVLALIAPLLQFGSIIVGVIGIVFLLPIAVVVMVRLYLNQYQFLQSMVWSVTLFLLSTTPSLLMGAGFIDVSGFWVEISVPALLISLVLLSLTQAEQVRNKSEAAESTLAANQAKDEFLTTMSHELRTPMHAVVGAGRLLDTTALSNEQQELVVRLNHSSAHMLSLINNILDLSRAESHLMSLESEPFKLSDVLASLNKLLGEAAENKGISLRLSNHFTPFKQELQGDEVRLKQVLLNILNNAIKFTEEGEVCLTITPLEVETDSARLNFEITDTGIGIPKEKIGDLFQPFTQAESSTSRRYGGSGLGLSISHKLVQLMGGELKVKSVLNEGSCFSFDLILVLKASKSVAKKGVSELLPENPDKGQPKGLKVLLVDDDEMNRFFGQKLLQVCGVEGFVADSGEQTLKFLEQQSFDLILLDISMPGMNGYQTAQTIRAQKELSQPVIVALTAHAIAGERERCLAAGMDDFLAKPFELSDLRGVLFKYSNLVGSGSQALN